MRALRSLLRQLAAVSKRRIRRAMNAPAPSPSAEPPKCRTCGAQGSLAMYGWRCLRCVIDDLDRNAIAPPSTYERTRATFQAHGLGIEPLTYDARRDIRNQR